MVRTSGSVRRGSSMMGVATAALLALGACGTSEPPPPPQDPPPAGFKSAIDLARMLPASADVVGVAVAPEGRRYVLDRHSGLYEIGGSKATLVFATSELASKYGLPADLELTDVVALGAERFALTAENDGYLLDLHNHTFASYFCYLPAAPGGPGSITVPTVSETLRSQGIAVKERTESVAYSPDSLQLYAQPHTIRVDTGQVMGSEVYVFSDGGGQPIQVRELVLPSVLAGGMVAVDGGLRLMLGIRNELAAVDPTSGRTCSGSSMRRSTSRGSRWIRAEICWCSIAPAAVSSPPRSTSYRRRASGRCRRRCARP